MIESISSPSRIKLYIAEEQQILRQAYQSFFIQHHSIEVVGSSGNTDPESLLGATSALKPDVILLGIKILQPSIVEKLEMIRESRPGSAIVLLSAYYDINGIKALREFSRTMSVGCAYLLKHTIDTVEQLTQVISAVSEGRIILDPAVMEGLVSASDHKMSFLRELTPRELEALSWMAKGYRNSTIAEIMGLETKTVERHINSIFSKLVGPDSKHPRVHAIMLYLRGTGILPAQGFDEE